MTPNLTLPLAGVLLLVPLGATGPAAAAAAAATERVQRTVQTTYACTTGSGASEQVELQVALDLPLSVAPGDQVEVTGRAVLTFAVKRTQNAQLLLNSKAALELPEAALDVTDDGTVERVALTGVKPAPAKVAKPIVTEAAFALTSFEVDQDAASSISVGLPENPAAATAAAFTAVLALSGGIATRQRFACRLPDGVTAPSVQVPVIVPAPARPAGPVVTPVAVAPPAAPVDLPVGAPAVGVPVPAVPVATPPTEPVITATTAFSAYESVPAATRSTGVFIPEWLLAVAGFGVLAAAVAVALRLRLRLRRLHELARHENEGAV